jgi:hypothetical protein
MHLLSDWPNKPGMYIEWPGRLIVAVLVYASAVFAAAAVAWSAAHIAFSPCAGFYRHFVIASAQAAEDAHSVPAFCYGSPLELNNI